MVTPSTRCDFSEYNPFDIQNQISLDYLIILGKGQMKSGRFVTSRLLSGIKLDSQIPRSPESVAFEYIPLATYSFPFSKIDFSYIYFAIRISWHHSP